MVENMHRPVEITIDQCIKCNICTTACPVSAVTEKFPGPKYEAPQAGRFRQAGQSTPDASVDYCSGCRVCNMVCPTGVKIAEMNARARASMVQQGKVSPVYRLRNNVIARAELVGKLSHPIAPVANAVLNFKPARLAMEKLLGIAREAPFPTISNQRFTPWFRHHQRDRHKSGEFPPPDRKVVYFHGCSTQYYEPRVGHAAVYVLERNGFEVVVPPQNCCGLPLLSNGEFAAARRFHTSNVRHLIEYARQGIPIVGTSTSCTLTIKEEAPELLDMFDEDTMLVAQQMFDLNEFLVSLIDLGELDLALKPLPLTLPYHVPCQYKGHRLGRPGVEVMDRIPGLRVIESDAACCGIAGTYGFKVEKYPIAMQVGEPLFEFVRQFGARLVVCDSETCRWQITHATGLPAIHPIELLAASYGFEPEGALATVLQSMDLTN
jgi:glycerol-3-phosphate dehydrogenase subunit C